MAPGELFAFSQEAITDWWNVDNDKTANIIFVRLHPGNLDAVPRLVAIVYVMDQYNCILLNQNMAGLFVAHALFCCMQRKHSALNT